MRKRILTYDRISVKSRNRPDWLWLRLWAGKSEYCLLPLKNFWLDPHEESITVFGKSGYVIGWYSPLNSQLIYESTRNQPRVTVRTPVGFLPLALNETRNRLAYLSGRNTPKEEVSLYWSSTDLSAPVLVTKHGWGTFGLEADWSPDGQSLVYEVRGQIYLYDTSNSTSKPLVRGRSPSWSPQGRWIAYRSPEDIASLITADGDPQTWPGGARKTGVAIRWSPDGKYIALPEVVQNPVPLIGAYYHLNVCRILDGACLTVKDFGA